MDYILATEINVAANTCHNMSKPQNLALRRSQTQRSMYCIFHLHEIQEQAKLICGIRVRTVVAPVSQTTYTGGRKESVWADGTISYLNYKGGYMCIYTNQISTYT